MNEYSYLLTAQRTRASACGQANQKSLAHLCSQFALFAKNLRRLKNGWLAKELLAYLALI